MGIYKMVRTGEWKAGGMLDTTICGTEWAE